MDHEQSQEIDQLAKALCAAQRVMGGARKSSTNPHLKSKYADLASCWDAVREPLADNGLAVIQTTGRRDGVTLVYTTLAHSSGQWVRGCTEIKPQRDDPQGVGSAITYGRRYGLAAIVGLTQDDDDAESSMRRGERAGKKPEPRREQQPARTDLVRGGNSMILFEDWKDLLGEPLAMKIRGKMASDEDVQGILIKFCKDAHFTPDRFTRPQLAVLGIVSKVASKRYAEEIVALEIDGDKYADACKAVGVVGPLKTLSAWDRRDIRDWLRSDRKKSEKATTNDRDDYGAQRYDVTLAPKTERITKAHARAIEASEDSEGM
jgi:hypothetical protein